VLGDDATRVRERENGLWRGHLAVTELRCDPILVTDRSELEMVSQGVMQHNSSFRRCSTVPTIGENSHRSSTAPGGPRIAVRTLGPNVHATQCGRHAERPPAGLHGWARLSMIAQ